MACLLGLGRAASIPADGWERCRDPAARLGLRLQAEPDDVQNPLLSHHPNYKQVLSVF